VDRPVDNLWIKRRVADRHHFYTSLLHFGADITSPLHHFSTLAQEGSTPLNVNANRYENDSHSAFFSGTTKNPISRIMVYTIGLI